MTTIFLIATIIISVMAFQSQNLLRKLIFNPYIINTTNQWYRFFSSGFIHADVIHLAVNMFVLYSFGAAVEFHYDNTFGERGIVLYVLLYISALMMSIIPTYNNHKFDPSYNGLGASGAVSAIVFAFILFDPTRPLALYGIIQLPGIVFGALYLAYCYYMAKRGGDKINHSAHMWGALYGVFFTLVMKPSLLPEFIEKLSNIGDAF